MNSFIYQNTVSLYNVFYTYKLSSGCVFHQDPVLLYQSYFKEQGNCNRQSMESGPGAQNLTLKHTSAFHWYKNIYRCLTDYFMSSKILQSNPGEVQASILSKFQ